MVRVHCRPRTHTETQKEKLSLHRLTLISALQESGRLRQLLSAAQNAQRIAEFGKERAEAMAVVRGEALLHAQCAVSNAEFQQEQLREMLRSTLQQLGLEVTPVASPAEEGHEGTGQMQRSSSSTEKHKLAMDGRQLQQQQDVAVDSMDDAAWGGDWEAGSAGGASLQTIAGLPITPELLSNYTVHQNYLSATGDVEEGVAAQALVAEGGRESLTPWKDIHAAAALRGSQTPWKDISAAAREVEGGVTCGGLGVGEKHAWGAGYTGGGAGGLITAHYHNAASGQGSGSRDGVKREEASNVAGEAASDAAVHSMHSNRPPQAGTWLSPAAAAADQDYAPSQPPSHVKTILSHTDNGAYYLPLEGAGGWWHSFMLGVGNVKSSWVPTVCVDSESLVLPHEHSPKCAAFSVQFVHPHLTLSRPNGYSGPPSDDRSHVPHPRQQDGLGPATGRRQQLRWWLGPWQHGGCGGSQRCS
jgi:hypothetical protein